MPSVLEEKIDGDTKLSLIRVWEIIYYIDALEAITLFAS